MQTDRQNPPSTTAVAAYFDDLHTTLARSPTQRRTVAGVLSEELAGLLGYAGPEELGWIAEAAAIRMGSRVLDVCCGAGDVARWLATHIGAVSVGIDCARQALILGARAGGRAGLVSGDVDTMPFATGSFDAVVSVDGFSYRPSLLMRECARVLRPDGRLGLLLSLAADRGAEIADTLADAGFKGVGLQQLTREASALLRRLRDAYRRHAREHVAEVGLRYHGALLDEIGALLEGYESGRTVRVLVTAQS